MAGFLLDTNVVSELRKRVPHPAVLTWHRNHVGADAYLSVLVIGEIRQGIERVRPRDDGKAAELDQWLTGLLARYRDQVLPVTAEVAQEWGRLNARSRAPVVDGLMVATAKVHRLTLVTRNTKDVLDTRVSIVNPFEVP
jgi:toxin FitB